jgi:7-carboxy-7-deazaguanine synthase
MPDSTLRLTEIFYSLQGETKTFGLPTVFIRLTGCPLRCSYCDTEYAFHGGDIFSFDEILTQLKSYNTPYITVTGGEPLAQKNCKQLLSVLAEAGYQVSLETSGALPIKNIDKRISIVLDLKTPASNESHRNLYNNIELLSPNDQIKFVICDRADYQWAKFKMDEYNLTEKAGEILFSPGFTDISLGN